MIKKLLNSSILRFISTKYLGYGLQFINSILIAKYLGLYYFGIYGFVNVFLHYLSFANLGVNYSLSVIISTDKTVSRKKTTVFLYNALLISTIVGVGILGLSIILKWTGLLAALDKYIFSEYVLLVILIATLKYYNVVYINIFRVFNKLELINLNFLLPGILQLVCIIFFKEIDLFWSLLIALLISQIIILILFIIKSPVPLVSSYDKESFNLLTNKGIFLMLYNLSLFLILLSARTLVSISYSVEIFGLFNLANTISTAFLLLMNSITFLIFPKMLNKFSKDSIESNIKFIERSRYNYLTITFLIIFICIAALPIVFQFIPQYKGSINSVIILLVGQLLISNNFGYAAFLVQRQKERILTYIGLFAVAIFIILGTSCALLKYSFDYVSISVVISIIIYNFLIITKANRILGQFNSKLALLKYMYHYKLFLPLILFLVLYIVSPFYILNILFVITLYIVLNIKELKKSIQFGKGLVLNNQSLDMDIDK